MVVGVLLLVLYGAWIPLTVATQAGFNAVVALPFSVVGLIVARRQPRNIIGWLLLALALSLVVSSDAAEYSLLDYKLGHHGLPLVRLAVFLAPGWIALIALLPLPILFFPDGQLPSGRWRWTLWAYLALMAVFLVLNGLDDVRAFTARHLAIDSSGELVQLGGGTVEHGWRAAVGHATLLLYPTITLSWVLRQVLSYRHASQERRQQLKWLMAGGGLCVVGMVELAGLAGATSTLWQAVDAVGLLGVLALPASLGVAILKYRLYDVDRLVSRTLSYAIVTGLLIGVYVGMVALTTGLLPFSSPVGVAASTLAAVALFTPVRRRVQRLVDRRFNRARYDAQATVTAFASRLQATTDLDAVRGELLLAVHTAIEPTHVSVWISPLRHV
jgi:uncharacterized membrane-anchored protein